jgi:hypothetical protein
MKISLSSLQKNFGWLQAVFGNKSVNKLVVQNECSKNPWAYIQQLSAWTTNKWRYFDAFCEKYLKANKEHQ